MPRVFDDVPGEAARTMRAVDWSATPVGDPSRWPRSLATMVSVMLRSRHPMFLWWGPSLTQFYNDAYLPSFGVGKHPAAMGQPGRECWPEIWPIIGPQIDDVMQRGKASWNEDQLVPIFRNGRIEDVFWTYGYSPVQDDDGSIAGTLVICTETTQRVVAERRQRSARALAEAMASAAPTDEVPVVAAAVLANASRDVPGALFFEQANAADPPRLVRWLGVDASGLAQASEGLRRRLAATPAQLAALAAGESVLLHDAIELALPDCPEAVRDAFLVPTRPADAGTSVHFVAYALHPRIPFDDGYRDFLVQQTHGISLAMARADADNTRRATETDRNNLLLQAPVAAAVFIGPDLVIEIANKAFCELVGRDDLVGKSCRDVLGDVSGDGLLEILQEAYRTGRRYVSREMRFVPGGVASDASGTAARHFAINLEPMRASRGEIYGLMAIATDISAQVEARKEIERSRDERQRRLEEAESASRAKDEFLAILGHELRNPLSPIVMSLELMRMHKEGSSQREQEVIRRQVDQLIRLVDDLMDVAAITRGKVRLVPAWNDLRDVVGRAVEMSRQVMEARRHVLDVALPDAPATWFGDATRLAQVVSNLLNNAALYTPAEGRIAVRVAVEADEIVLTVTDNGPGIAPELRPRVFDAFVQGALPVSQRSGGLGVGLAVVKQLVELHGGTVAIAAGGAERGSTFVVRLPRASPLPAGADAVV